METTILYLVFILHHAWLGALQRASPNAMGLSSSVCPEWKAEQWPQAFATSPWMGPRTTVSFRALWAAIFSAHVIWNWWVRGRGDGAYHFIFLTVQASWLEAFNLIVQWIVAMMGFPYLQTMQISPPEPCLARFSIALNSMSQPLSTVVAVLFWVLIYPDSGGYICYMDYFLYGINSGLLLLNLLVTRIPFSCARVGWLVLYQILYVGWTYAHYRLRIWALVEQKFTFYGYLGPKQKFTFL